jgi:hypothetical protein
MGKRESPDFNAAQPKNGRDIGHVHIVILRFSDRLCSEEMFSSPKNLKILDEFIVFGRVSRTYISASGRIEGFGCIEQNVQSKRRHRF